MGIDTPQRLNTLTIWSSMRSFLMAEIMPMGMPINNVNIMAVIVSSRVAGKYCASAAATGLPPSEADRPRLK